MTRAIRKHLGDFIALAALFAISIAVTAYIVSQQESRPYFPFIEKPPYRIKAQFSDAQAVVPGQGQTVRVAGVEVGKISGVEPKNGVAVVTMDLNRDMIDNHELQVRSDATAQMRPRTGLKDMFIELDPGTSGHILKQGGTIPVQNTEPDVNPDEFLSSLDADTRSYLQLLINGLGEGFKNRGNDLNATFKALGPTQEDLKRIASAIAARHTQLARLVHNYGDLTNTLANTDGDIQRLVNSSNDVLSAFAQENQNISSAVAKLPSTLAATRTTLAKVGPYSDLLRTSLESLRPAFRQLDVTNHQVLPFVTEAFPIIRDQIRPFVQVARPYVQDLRPAAHGLRVATPDLVQVLYELNRFFNMLAFNPAGNHGVPSSCASAGGCSGSDAATAAQRQSPYLFWVGWVTHLSDSLFSTSDSRGPFRRALFGVTCDTIKSQLNTNLGQAGPIGPGLQGAAAGVEQTLFGLSNAITGAGICTPGFNP
ncbi:MAG: MCE family protein [Actinobacteria bacterium]|nr:MCE family protein [Actinomycetota bacterium]